MRKLSVSLTAVLLSTGIMLPATSSSAEVDSYSESQTPIATLKPSELDGRSVQTQNGQKLGQVTAIVVGQGPNQMGFVVPVGGFLGLGATDVFVPADEVQLDGDVLVWQTRQPADQIVYFSDYNEQQYRQVTNGYESLSELRQSRAP